MNFEIIPTPHLPTGKVCHVACGQLPYEMQTSLLQYTDEIITIQKQINIESALQHHADLSICPLPENRIIISDSQLSLKEKLISLGFCVIMKENIQSPYPKDCSLNFVNTKYYSIINNNIHMCANYHICENMVISVRQGYIKCSVAPVAKNAIITDDPGIAKICSENGLDVCYVQKGDILLNGYNYGFIGGCCGKVNEHQMAFCGNLETHRDFKHMTDFLAKYDITVINLSDSQLTDVGSLIPLTQEKG